MKTIFIFLFLTSQVIFSSASMLSGSIFYRTVTADLSRYYYAQGKHYNPRADDTFHVSIGRSHFFTLGGIFKKKIFLLTADSSFVYEQKKTGDELSLRRNLTESRYAFSLRPGAGISVFFLKFLLNFNFEYAMPSSFTEYFRDLSRYLRNDISASLQLEQKIPKIPFGIILGTEYSITAANLAAGRIQNFRGTVNGGISIYFSRYVTSRIQVNYEYGGNFLLDGMFSFSYKFSERVSAVCEMEKRITGVNTWPLEALRAGISFSTQKKSGPKLFSGEKK
ncbi:MAG: hypothetical protein A2096_15890 [Spirochaetes bacterium GWF1_41_5]|nr:MAG: hypothetical protein A2096_15890 [Spirochaetes bacterium GWF1_41_5]HBE03094.1 hypothetical protein [Spirochaetia bacterium]